MDEYNFALDIHALAQDIQGNSRAAPLQEMTRISEVVTFLLARRILEFDVANLPKRPCKPPEKAPKSETKTVRDARKKIAARLAADLKKWDPIDTLLLNELENLRYLHAASSHSDSSKPSGFVQRRSEQEQDEANLAEFAQKAGVEKKSAPPSGAVVLPRRGEAVSESTPGLFSLMCRLFIRRPLQTFRMSLL